MFARVDGTDAMIGTMQPSQANRSCQSLLALAALLVIVPLAPFCEQLSQAQAQTKAPSDRGEANSGRATIPAAKSAAAVRDRRLFNDEPPLDVFVAIEPKRHLRPGKTGKAFAIVTVTANGQPAVYNLTVLISGGLSVESIDRFNRLATTTETSVAAQSPRAELRLTGRFKIEGVAIADGERHSYPIPIEITGHGRGLVGAEVEVLAPSGKPRRLLSNSGFLLCNLDQTLYGNAGFKDLEVRQNVELMTSVQAAPGQKLDRAALTLNRGGAKTSVVPPDRRRVEKLTTVKPALGTGRGGPSSEGSDEVPGDLAPDLPARAIGPTTITGQILFTDRNGVPIPCGSPRSRFTTGRGTMQIVSSTPASLMRTDAIHSGSSTMIRRCRHTTCCSWPKQSATPYPSSIILAAYASLVTPRSSRRSPNASLASPRSSRSSSKTYQWAPSSRSTWLPTTGSRKIQTTPPSASTRRSIGSPIPSRHSVCPPWTRRSTRSK